MDDTMSFDPHSLFLFDSLQETWSGATCLADLLTYDPDVQMYRCTVRDM